MIDIVKILQHNIVGKLINHGLVFLINICIVRFLGGADSGIYFNELYLINFFAFIFSLGIDFSIISFMSQDPGMLGVLRKKMAIVLLFFVGLILLLTFFILPGIISNYFKQPLWAVILFCAGNLMLIFYQGLLSALKKFNLQNIILIVTNMVFLAYLLYAYRTGRTMGFEVLAKAYGILFFIQGMIMFFASYQFRGSPQKSISWRKFIKPGFYMMLTSLVYFAFLRIDNFFVERYCDKEVLGSYVLCGKIGQYFIYFSSIISSTLLPFIANESIGSSYSEWWKVTRLYFILISLAALFIAASGKHLFPFLFGSEFAEMYKIMLILLPGFVCLGILTLMNSVYIGKGNIKRIFIGDLLGLLMVTILDILLIPAYGVYAAAMISSVSYMLVFLYLLTGFKRQFTYSKTGIFQL